MDDLKRLKELDPDEVLQRTYIAPKVLRALVEGEFGRLGSRMRALGFVRILEREYGLDLSELKERIDVYFVEREFSPVSQQPPPSWGPDDEDGRFPRWVAGLFAGVVAGIVLYLVWGGGETKSGISVERVAKKSRQEEVGRGESGIKKSVVPQKKEQNRSLIQKEDSTPIFGNDANISQQKSKSPEPQKIQEANTSQKPPPPPRPRVTILPTKKVWVGIIYLDNYEKRAFVTSRPIDINTSRDQLILTGHGYLRIDESGDIQEYKDRRKLRFLFRAGRLEMIDPATFRRYNRGKEW
jgi:cytoskeletal protein RodZ